MTTVEQRARVTLRQQLPLLLALVVLWMLLWGSITPLTIVTGVVVALGVTRAFFPLLRRSRGLVLVDWHMPNLDGVETIRRIVAAPALPAPPAGDVNASLICP